MKSLTFVVLLCCFCFGVPKPGDDTDSAKEVDRQGYDAIAQLHKSMDDDLSGSIDLTESTEFLREELHVKDKDPLARRQQTFHHNNDESITIDDLWKRWVASEERNWTVDDVADWLVKSVELPQYVDIFTRNGVNGSRLPRLAAQNTSYFQTVLGITNPVHRQKLQLKAMDVVLFGYRGPKSSYIKDILLVALLVVAVVAYWFAMYQRKASQKQAQALTTQLGKLKDMEQEFVDLQNKLEEERHRQESSKASVEDEEIGNIEELESLKYQLQEAERQREQRSPLLQSLLRKTYELEISRINQQKLDSLKEMNEAREMVEKLRKKQSSLLNQIRSVHGSETEEIDERIVSVRQKMEKTARSIEECEQRWVEIEYLMGFKITNSSSASGTRVVPGGALSAYSRPNFYGPGSVELESDAGSIPLADVTDPRAQFGEPIFRTSQHLHHRPPGSGVNLTQRGAKSPVNTGSNFIGNTTSAIGHCETASQLYRPKLFNIAGSDMLRSASASDLMASGNGSPSSSVGTPVNDLTHTSSASASARRNHPPPLTLAQIGKKASQNSMGTGSGSDTNPNPVKPKKKILNLFSGSRDKRD